MISFLLRHLLESTFFCLLLGGVACCLRKSATARCAVLLMGVAKFAIPTVVLAKTGESLAAFWPAASWLSVATYKISVWLATIQNWFPTGHGRVLLGSWALGTGAMATIWLFRLRGNGSFFLLPTEREQEALVRARRLLRVRGDVRLRFTDEASAPALLGIWRPTITAPLGLIERLTAAEFDGVLLHELAHARRFDNLTGAFVHLLVCLFWFHPLLWLVERRLLVERERACDETVMSCGVKAQAYAAGILKVCQFQIFDPAPGVSAMTGADLKGRLELILDKPKAAGPLYVPWLLVASLTVFMTLVPVAGGYCEQCAYAPTVRCKTPATCLQNVQKGIR
jgi:beta-lactamase regulating signal transducer with metallopeptidase domain